MPRCRNCNHFDDTINGKKFISLGTCLYFHGVISSNASACCRFEYRRYFSITRKEQEMSREDFEGIKQYAKEQHNKRVAKTPNRISYAIEQFEHHNIEYVLRNISTGHFHCRRKRDDKLFQFYAGTGKIMGYENKRGIHALIELLEEN